MLMSKLKEARKGKGMTQSELAKACGISRNSIVNWETGKNTPKLGDIEKLSAVLGISPHELMENSLEINNKEKEKTTDTQPKGYAYWGGVIDEARKVAERGDEMEMSSIEPLLKLAYEMLLSGISRLAQNKTVNTAPNISAYNGNNSNYSGNSLTVGATA